MALSALDQPRHVCASGGVCGVEQDGSQRLKSHGIVLSGVDHASQTVMATRRQITFLIAAQIVIEGDHRCAGSKAKGRERVMVAHDRLTAGKGVTFVVERDLKVGLRA